jgi:MFS superfamily sulfate permease-like transporter
MAGGVATSALVLLSNPFTIWIPVALLAASAIITAIGWRRIKNEPKKYKGEKLAVLNYLVIGIIGVAASVYLIWLLFEL